MADGPDSARRQSGGSFSGGLHLTLKRDRVKVTLKLADVGGPASAYTSRSASLTSWTATALAATSPAAGPSPVRETIDADGKVGAVGGVALKAQAARRDGATVFLVPKAEYSDAKAALPTGLRLIPVTTLKSAVSALTALEKANGPVPSC